MTPTEPLKIGAWPDKFPKGIRSYFPPWTDSEGVVFEPLNREPMTISEALETEHPSDAHMTLYSMVREDGTPVHRHPLLRKPFLKDVRKVSPEIEEGPTDVYSVAVAFDWDMPHHQPLTEEARGDFIKKFFALSQLDPRWAQYHSIYTSANGTRVVFELKDPIRVDEAEGRYNGMIKEAKEFGIEFDEGCFDWTRRFRLPRVIRDGKRTSKNPLFMQVRNENVMATLDLKSFPIASSPRTGTTVACAAAEQTTRPTPEECHKLLHEPSQRGGEKMTEFHKKAKAILAGCPYFDSIFNEQIAFCEVDRNNYIGKVIGFIIPRLISGAFASRSQIYSLLDGPLSALEPQAGPSWEEKTWQWLGDIYTQEKAKHEEVMQKRREEKDEGLNSLDKIIEGMKNWCNHDDLLSSDPEIAREYARGHLLANVGRFYFPISKDGYFTIHSVSDKQLVSTIRNSHLSHIVPTRKRDRSGEMTSVSANEIINNHSTVVRDIKYKPQLEADGFIEKMDGWGKAKLVLPMYRRNPSITPKFDPFVDGWLRSFFEEHYELAARWIGYALAIEEGPICALSMEAPPGVGKKLLLTGLAECMEEPKVAPAAALGHDFNEILLCTPFLHVNEAWPKLKGVDSPSDRFKDVTGGDDIYIKEKFKNMSQIVSPLRLVFTANNGDLLSNLFKGRVLTPEDKQAVGERLIHVKVGDGGREYLNELGGNAFTAQSGARWIRGDSAADSDYIVARHFMWLYENRPARRPEDLRFCVRGNCADGSSILDAAARGESLYAVTKALINMVEVGAKAYHTHLKFGVDGRTYVTLSGVQSYIADNARESRQDRVPDSELYGVMRSLVVSEEGHKIGGKNFYELDLKVLLRHAEEWGIDANQIRGQLAVLEGIS